MRLAKQKRRQQQLQHYQRQKVAKDFWAGTELVENKVGELTTNNFNFNIYLSRVTKKNHTPQQMFQNHQRLQLLQHLQKWTRTTQCWIASLLNQMYPYRMIVQSYRL